MLSYATCHDFVAIQPTAKPGATVGISYGSNSFKNVRFDLRTGNVDGFSAVLAGGVSSLATISLAACGCHPTQPHWHGSAER